MIVFSEKSIKIAKINGIEKHHFGVALRAIVYPQHSGAAPDQRLCMHADDCRNTQPEAELDIAGGAGDTPNEE